MKVSNNAKLLRAAAAGLALAIGTGSALARQDGSFNKPLSGGRGAQAGGNGSSRSTTVMRSDDGDHQVELRIEDGKYSAKVNGKKIPEDRIVRENDEVRILDKDGNTITTFHVSVVGDGDQGVNVLKHKAPKSGTHAAPKAPDPLTTAVKQPKVMLGVTMGEPSDSLRKNYDLKEGETILIERVIEGLPADKAGIKANDIITEIDGKKPVNQDVLREVLRGKDPGDVLTFTVLRKGGDQTIRVTLDKFDADKLGMNIVPNVTGGDAEAYKDMAEKAMRDALKNGNGQWKSFTLPGDNNGQAFVWGGNGNPDDRVAELDKKMAELDEKLTKVNEQIARLQDMIDKLSKQHSGGK